MPLDLKRGIVRILAADGSTTSGTGFILSEKGIIVTCSHVVQAEKLQVRGYPRPERVEIVFRANGEKAAARLLPQAWRAADGEDVAFLQLEGPMPQDVEPLPLGSSDGAAGHQFQSFGFPDQSPVEGLYGEGQLIEQTSILGMKVWQVKSSEITPGFSGGPVYDREARHVVGMVTSIAAPDKFGRLSETAFVTPAETLFSILPEIATSDVPPYMGLAAFTEKDAEFFFGRRKLVEGLEETLRARPRFLLVMGPSGSGKSSLVQAGLMPRLRKGSVPGSDRWGIFVARPADRPFENLERVGLRGAYADLAQAVRGWIERNPGQEKLLLILDQFEEFLVTCPPDLRQRLWEGLKGLLDSDIELTVMAVMRDDFYSRFASDAPPEVLAWTQQGFFQVGTLLEKEELREIISEPARQVGLRLEEGLVDVIINDVLESSQDGGGRAGRSTVLPLLEFALTQLWKRQEQGVLTHQAYQAAGKVTGSLTAWADQVCRALEEDGLGPVARRVFIDLVNLGDGTHPDSRRQRRLADLVHDGKDETELEAVQKVVQRLADARLVTTSLDMGEESVQIIHDSLIREWARLQRWLKKSRSFLAWERELEKNARAWNNSASNVSYLRDDDRLLRGMMLIEAETWLKEHNSELSIAEREFIQASLDLRDKEKKKVELAREEKELTRSWIIKGLAFFLLVAICLASFGLYQRDQAEKNENEATILYLAGQSEVLQQAGQADSFFQGVLLAIESLKRQPTLAGTMALRHGMTLLPRKHFSMMHNESVLAIAFSPDGTKIATASGDKTAKLWDVSTGKMLKIMNHSDAIWSVAFNDNGTKIATSSSDQTAKIWNVATGEMVIGFEHNGWIKKVLFSKNREMIATASMDGTINIWNITNGENILNYARNGEIKSIAFSPDSDRIAIAGEDGIAKILSVDTGDELAHMVHNADVNSIVFSPDGLRIATASNDYTARLWDASNSKLLAIMNHSDYVSSVAFNPAGTRLVTASWDKTARIWDVSTGKEERKLGHDEEIISAEFSPDGKKIATASNDKTARLWEVSTGKELAIMGHRSRVNAIAFSPDSSLIATASSDHSANLWETSTGAELYKLIHNDLVRSISFSPDGARLITVSDKTARIWDATSEKEFVRLNHSGEVVAAAFSSDWALIATACKDGTSIIWNPANGKNLINMSHNSSARAIAFNPNSTKIAIAYADGAIRIIDIATGKELINMSHKNYVKKIVFSPNGLVLASASGDKTVRLWNSANGKELRKLIHDKEVMDVVFSPDGKRIASASFDFTARIWNTDTGKEIKLVHDKEVISAAFNLDGTKILTASLDGTARIWDTFTGKELAKLNHSKDVVAASFSPDGERVATAGFDCCARIWDALTGKELDRVNHDDFVIAASFSPDGTRLATSSFDGTARIWILGAKDLSKEACRRLNRNLAPDEWEKYISNEPCRKTCPDLR